MQDIYVSTDVEADGPMTGNTPHWTKPGSVNKLRPRPSDGHSAAGSFNVKPMRQRRGNHTTSAGTITRSARK